MGGREQLLCHITYAVGDDQLLIETIPVVVQSLENFVHVQTRLSQVKLPSDETVRE